MGCPQELQHRPREVTTREENVENHTMLSDFQGSRQTSHIPVFTRGWALTQMSPSNARLYGGHNTRSSEQDGEAAQGALID